MAFRSSAGMGPGGDLVWQEANLVCSGLGVSYRLDEALAPWGFIKQFLLSVAFFVPKRSAQLWKLLRVWVPNVTEGRDLGPRRTHLSAQSWKGNPGNLKGPGSLSLLAIGTAACFINKNITNKIIINKR